MTTTIKESKTESLVEAILQDLFITPETLLTRVQDVLSDKPPVWEVVEGNNTCSTPHLFLYWNASKRGIMYLGKVQPGTFIHDKAQDIATYMWTTLPIQYAFVHVEGGKFGEVCFLSETEVRELTIPVTLNEFDIDNSVMYQLGATALLRDYRMGHSLSWEIINTRNLPSAHIFQPAEKFSASSPLVIPFQTYRFSKDNPLKDFSLSLNVYVATCTIKISEDTLDEFKAALHSLTRTTQFGFALDDSFSIKLTNDELLEVPGYQLKPEGPRKIGSQQVSPSVLSSWQKAVDSLNWASLKNKDIDGWTMDDVLGEVLSRMQWYQIMLISPNQRFAWVSS